MIYSIGEMSSQSEKTGLCALLKLARSKDWQTQTDTTIKYKDQHIVYTVAKGYLQTVTEQKRVITTVAVVEVF